MFTRGWDLISMIKRDRLNLGLQKECERTDPYFYDKLDGMSGHIEGYFGAFRITGGNERILFMEVPIRRGTLYADNGDFSLEGVCAAIEITLEIIREESGLLSLKTDYCGLNQDNVPSATGQFSAVSCAASLHTGLEGADGLPSEYREAVFNAICRHFSENSEQLKLTLANIEPVKEGCPEWAIPKKCAYSFLDSDRLAVMAVCDDRDISGLPLDIHALGISASSDIFFILSASLMIRNIMFPSLMKLYRFTNESRFEFSDNMLINSLPVEMRPIWAGPVFYSPLILCDRNITRIYDDHIFVRFGGDCIMYFGITMPWDGSVRLLADLNENGSISFNGELVDFKYKKEIPHHMFWASRWIDFAASAFSKAISVDFIKALNQVCGSINTNAIETVNWAGAGSSVKAASIDNESLILEYA